MTATDPLSTGGTGAHVASPEALTALVRDLAPFDPHALCVLVRGVVVARTGWAPYRPERPALVHSVSKTVTALVVGLLVADGVLTVADRVVDLAGRAGLPLGEVGPRAARLTVADLLAMRTGHTPEQLREADPRVWDVAGYLAIEPVHDPGTYFAYSSPATAVLSALVTALTGQRVGDIAAARVLGPAGIGPRWWVPLAGLPEADQGFSGLHLSVDDLARLGELLRGRGEIDGARVVPAAWIDEMTRVHVPTVVHDPVSPDYRAGYGYQVWRSTHGFRADGAYGQFVLVVPEAELVVAVTAGTTDQQGLLRVCWRLVDPPPGTGGAAPTAPQLASALPQPETDWPWPRQGEPVPAVAPAGVRVHRHGPGWLVDLVGAAGSPEPLPVGEGTWVHSRSRVADGRVLALAGIARATGERWSADVIVEQTPHRLLLDGTADPAGTVTDVRARWQVTPLWNPDLGHLAVPERFLAGP